MAENFSRTQADKGFVSTFMGPVFWLGVLGAVGLWALDAALAGGAADFFRELTSPPELLRRVPSALALIGLAAIAQRYINRAGGPDTDLVEDLAIIDRRLSDSQRLAQMGSWEYDVTADTMWWSDEVFRQLGVERESCIPSTAKFLELVHPDDLDMVRESNADAIENGLPISRDQRIVR